jgi:two-component system sensor histidine kinase QseC
LVEQLLQLARVDASETSANNGTQATCDLVDVARQVLANLAPAASIKRQNVELVSPEHCRIPGDAALLSALLRNLVDNAIRYSPTQATVCVTITRSESHKVRLRVEDSGAGLTAELQQQLGQRFVRGLGSGEDGSGLGWSIVTRIAKLLDLEIDIATSTSYGGLAVQLTWPQARTDAT